MKAMEGKSKSKEVKAAIFLNITGEEAVEMFYSFDL